MRYLFPCLLLIVCSCHAPASDEVSLESPMVATKADTGEAAERAANEAVLQREGARLAAEVPGAWVLIAHGSVRGTWPDFESGWRAAQAEDAAHLYLYRAGIDDGDVTFVLSPFGSTDPRWTQLGHRFWGPFKLTLEAAGDVWSRKVDGETLRVAWGDAGARLELTLPGDGPVEVERTVPSMLFEYDVSLTETLASSLDLGRIEAPGRAWYSSSKWPCRKVILRLRIPELRIDEPVVGFVLPADLTER